MNTIKHEVNRLMKAPVTGKPIGIIKLQMIREHQSLYGAGRLNSPKAAAEFIQPLFERADRELMVVVSLNSRLEPLAIEIAAVGGLEFCQIDIKNLFKHALLNNAGSIICFHNHPSGDASPSKEDTRITDRMKRAGELLGIPVKDHIIIGDGCYCSLSELGKC